jgi:DNA polymerase I
LGSDVLPGQILLLLDANSLINRAYFGLLGRQNLTAPDGTPTGALFAFYNMLLKYLDEIKPTHAAAAFDRKEPTFRQQWFDGYKATRKPMPDELAIQIPILKELLDRSGVRCVEYPGFEADDLIGTLAEAGKGSQMDVFIISGDKDSFQLASRGITILQPVTRGGRTETEKYDPAAIYSRYQVKPEQMVDLKAIMGDPSDNIPGVQGIGEKGAIELISRFGSLDGVFAALPEIRPALAVKLRANREMAYLSKRLSEISRAAPISADLSAYQLRNPDPGQLRALLIRLGFRNVLARLNLATSAAKPAEQVREDLATDLSSFLGVVAGHPELPGLWLAEDKRLAWSAGPGHAGWLAPDQTAAAWEALQERDCQPAVYDYKSMLHKAGLPNLSTSVHDVLIAAYLLNQIDGRPDLARIYERTTGKMVPDDSGPAGQLAEPAKDQGQWVQDDLFSTLAAEGLAEDPAELATKAGLIREIAKSQKDEIGQRGIGFLAYEVEMPLVAILAGMEKYGFAVDADVLSDLSDEMSLRLEVLQDEIYRSCGCRFNLNSPKQLGEILYQHLGLAAGKKAGSGAYSTDSDELDRLSGEHPSIPLIIEHRQTAKLRSTFVEGLKKVLDPADGRVHTTFNQALTATGRLSSSEPNLQNIPIRMEAGQKIRRAFIAPPGCILIDADYSQIELRLLAHLSGDQAMIDSFLRMEDIHLNTACRIFGRKPQDITPEMRSIAKTMNFSIVYGVSDFGLARGLGVTVRQAHNLIAEYEAQYPQVRLYLDSLVKAAYTDGYVETLYGRRRYLPELKSPNRSLRQFGERAAMNTPVQGAAADLIKVAMVLADRRLREARLSARLILQVHDELIVEAPLEEAESAGRILGEAMTGAAELKVPLLAEVRQGKNWAECK